MDDATAAKIVRALRGLARVNAFEFCQSPTLRSAYVASIQKGQNVGGIIYVPDPDTCGLPDCWSSWRGLTERYGLRAELSTAAPWGHRIPLDCEDIAMAHAGYLSATGTKGVYAGFIAGKQISHAILGVKDRRGEIHVLDPAVWVGMGEFGKPYRPIYWAEV